MKRDYEDLGGADPWQVLGVAREADDAAIKRAHRQRTPTQHPDAGGDHVGQTRLNLARDVLLDPVRRRDYVDRMRKESTAAGPPAPEPTAPAAPPKQSAPKQPAPKPAAQQSAAHKPAPKRPAPKPSAAPRASSTRRSGPAKAARPESAADYEDLVRPSSTAGSPLPRARRRRFSFVSAALFAPSAQRASVRVPPPVYRRYPPPTQARPPSYAGARPYSGLAIAALAVSPFCFPVGLLLAIFALVECHQTGRRGTALAWAAIGVSVLMVVAMCTLYMFASGIDTPSSSVRAAASGGGVGHDELALSLLFGSVHGRV